jgi:hypothetical protein
MNMKRERKRKLGLQLSLKQFLTAIRWQLRQSQLPRFQLDTWTQVLHISKDWS